MARLDRAAEPLAEDAQPPHGADDRRARRRVGSPRASPRRHHGASPTEIAYSHRDIVMKALMIDAPGSAKIVDRPEPAAGRGDVLVRVARAGLCGTDLSTFL